MTRSPRLSTLACLALAVLAVGLGVAVPRAAATDPFPTTGVATLSSAHFMVHYSTNNLDSTCKNYTTQDIAGSILGMAERAYAYYGSLAYPAPIPESADGDALIDISIDDFSAACVAYGSISGTTPIPLSRWNALITDVAPAGAGELHIDVHQSLNYHLIAHEIFHLVQRAISTGGDRWLAEGTAEWAAAHADAAVGGKESSPERAADCVGSECGLLDFDRAGYSGWMLFEYLSERYNGAVGELWNTVAGQPLASGTADLSDVLGAHGTSLSSFFKEYAKARLTGDFTFAPLAGDLPLAPVSIKTGHATGPIPTTSIAVNHLAVSYLSLEHGGSSDDPCYEATLTINVTIPASLTSATTAPYFWDLLRGPTPQALTISGSTASITVPWDTCFGSASSYLSLPNASWSPGLDGREFIVNGTITVDKTKPATTLPPPPWAPINTPVISAPSTDPAPDLKLYAPALIRVSAKTRLLRFIVFSSGDGTLKATLGSTWRGSGGLHVGNNDIRFVLPTQLLKSLRKTNTPANVLTLTSYSAGGTQGVSTTRRVAMAPVKKPPKPKRRQ